MPNKVLTTSIPLNSLVRLNDTNNSPLEVLVQLESGGGGGGNGGFGPFVNPTFAGTPDGSINSPWPTVNQAIAQIVAGGGNNIVLAAETYLDNVVVPLGLALQVTLLDYAGERAEFLNPWTWNCQDGDGLAIKGCVLPSVALVGTAPGAALLALVDCTCSAVSPATTTQVSLVVTGQVYGRANEQSTADSVLGTVQISGSYTLQNTVCLGNVNGADGFLTKCFVNASRTFTAAGGGGTIGLQQVEFGGTHGTPTAFNCGTLQIDPYSQWAGRYPQPTAQLFTCTGTIVPTPRIPASSVQLLAVIDSGSTGNLLADGTDQWLRTETTGGFVEADFGGIWNPGDILRVSFTCTFRPAGGPGGVQAAFQIEVSLDGGGTWQTLQPACTNLQFDFTLVQATIYSVSGYASIALATGPLVRIAYQIGGNILAVNYGANQDGISLSCERFDATSSIATNGTLV